MVATDPLDGLGDLGDAVDGQDAEGEVAQGGGVAGSVAQVGLLVVFAPYGVAGAVLEILDSPVPAGVWKSALVIKARLVTIRTTSLLVGRPEGRRCRGGSPPAGRHAAVSLRRPKEGRCSRSSRC